MLEFEFELQVKAVRHPTSTGPGDWLHNQNKEDIEVTRSLKAFCDGVELPAEFMAAVMALTKSALDEVNEYVGLREWPQCES